MTALTCIPNGIMAHVPATIFVSNQFHLLIVSCFLLSFELKSSVKMQLNREWIINTYRSTQSGYCIKNEEEELALYLTLCIKGSHPIQRLLAWVELKVTALCISLSVIGVQATCTQLGWSG